MNNKHIVFKEVRKITNLFLHEEVLKDFNPKPLIEKIKANVNKELSYKTNVRNKMTDWQCFSKDPTMSSIFANMSYLVGILLLPDLQLASCWGTWSSKYVETFQHKHSPSDISGILYLTEGGPGTYFPEFNINAEEKIGKLVFFHGDTLHKVEKSKIKKDRFLISFNFEKIKFWSPLKK